MIKYAKTYGKYGVPSNIPLEDKFYFDQSQNLAVIADGITRDSFDCPNLNTASDEAIFQNYPNPSPAAQAAEVVCNTFANQRHIQDLEKVMHLANANVHKLNQNVECDYLEHDYAACVAASAYIKNHTLNYAYVCDCGIIVWDKNGNIRFKTSDDKLLVDPYIAQALEKTPWHLPEGRVVVRRDFRNNPDNIQDGKCVSYGALTGEKNAEFFIKHGSVALQEGDTVAVFSDGFSPYFKLPNFFEHLDNLESLEKLVEAWENKPNFKSEKTIIVMSLD